MSKFIAANQEKAEAFVAKISQTLFRDPEVFIQMFNSGLINRKNEEVSNIADELLTVFKGIERKGDKITFLDQGEIVVEDMLIKLEAYQVALQLKRVLASSVAEGLAPETEVYLDGKGGLLSAESDLSISKEKVAKLSEKGYEALAQILNVTDFGVEILVPADRFLGVDATPVINAADLLR